jgi:hypothetical protein
LEKGVHRAAELKRPENNLWSCGANHFWCCLGGTDLEWTGLGSETIWDASTRRMTHVDCAARCDFWDIKSMACTVRWIYTAAIISGTVALSPAVHSGQEAELNEAA